MRVVRLAWQAQLLVEDKSPSLMIKLQKNSSEKVGSAQCEDGAERMDGWLKF